MSREEMIDYIISNDITYNYEGVNFKYYTDEELLFLKKKIEREKNNKAENEKLQ